MAGADSDSRNDLAADRADVVQPRSKVVRAARCTKSEGPRRLRTDAGDVRADGSGSVSGGTDAGAGKPGSISTAQTLRAELQRSALDTSFWLKVAEVVLNQSVTLTEENVRMLAVCSDQANKSKLLGSKGIGTDDPLAVIRERLTSIFGKE